MILWDARGAGLRLSTRYPRPCRAKLTSVPAFVTPSCPEVTIEGIVELGVCFGLSTFKTRAHKVSITAICEDLVPVTVPLKSVYLDPNNPRFVGPLSKWVEDEDIDLEKVQEEARRLLVRDYDVDKLRMNMEVNGYLPIDRIVVRRFKNDKFVVLEGNRRVAAAKMIGQVATDGSAVSDEVLRSLVDIPCLEYVGGEQDAAWIFQGLRHITGITEWSAYNKARLLVEQMEEEDLTLTAVGRRFGLTPFG